MAQNGNLFNAVVIAENPEMAFIADGNHLHAVDRKVAELQKDKSKPELVLPLMRKGFEALCKYAQGKVEQHFINSPVSSKPNEQDRLIENIQNIYTHLPHHDRNELSSLIHHKQLAGKKG